MNVFIVTSKYNLTIALNIILNEYIQDENIIILCDFNKSMKELYFNLNYKFNYSVFYYYNFSNSSISRIFEYIRFKRKFSKEFKGKICSNFLSTWFVPFGEIIFNILKKNNKDLRYTFLEEGMSSYVNTYNRNSFTIKSKIILFLINRKSLMNYEYDLLIYEPRLLCSNITGKIREISKVNLENVNIFNDLFLYNENYVYKEKFIYLEQPFNTKGKLNLDENNIIEMFHSNFNSDFIIKRHPKSKKIIKQRFVNDVTPWEIICMNINIECKVLITIYSTAVITPKIMLDKEPIIILLYKFFSDIDNFDEIDNLFESLKEVYTDKNKIIIPESIDELVNILKGFN